MAHDGCALFRRHHYRKTHQPASTTPSRQSARNWGPPEEAEVIEDAEVKDAMDVDHLAAEDSDEGGLTGECQQVIPGCSCRQFTCNIFPAHCPNAQMMCRLFVDEDKAAAGHRLLEVAPPFHMAAGSEQEEDDQVETSESSGRPGPTQSSGEGAHHLRSCQTIAEALVEARLPGNLQSRIVRLVAKAGVPQGLAREVPLPTSHCGDQRPQMHCRARRPDRWPVTGGFEETVREASDQQ